MSRWSLSMRFDLSVYLVTDATLCQSYGLERTVKEAVEGGVTMVQLRDKHANEKAMIEQAKRLSAVLKPRGIPLIINDRLNVALASSADGLHVGQSDSSVREARDALGPNAIIGLSINTHAQLNAMPIDALNYVGLGPVFATASKQDHAVPLGFDGLAALAKESAVPSVAIGGLKAQHIDAVQRSGAHGMAVISAICGQDSPQNAARELATRWHQREVMHSGGA
jgi:thiamine-phosphate pyrophosphorylase